jgi:hypothetical protein
MTKQDKTQINPPNSKEVYYSRCSFCKAMYVSPRLSQPWMRYTNSRCDRNENCFGVVSNIGTVVVPCYSKDSWFEFYISPEYIFEKFNDVYGCLSEKLEMEDDEQTWQLTTRMVIKPDLQKLRTLMSFLRINKITVIPLPHGIGTVFQFPVVRK